MNQKLYDIPVKTINGLEQTLATHAGKVLLVVNVASRCGLTEQYEGLENLYRQKRDQGLVILGFPANDFMQQEPGTDEEIAHFCSTRYDVQFPMFSRISVVGEEKHPLYTELTRAQPAATGEGPMRERLIGYGIKVNPPPEVLWNFEKFLVGRDGQVLNRFAPDVTVDDPRLLHALNAALADH